MPRPPWIPTILQRRHSDEFAPPAYSARDRRVIGSVVRRGEIDAPRLALPLGDYWAGRHGTAAGLIALNDACGERFYEVPPEAALDRAAAEEALGGDELIVDVQTHYIADRSLPDWNDDISRMYRSITPDWWKGVDEVVAYDMSEYLRCVFLESDTAVAVLTSGPGLGPDRMLFNREIAGTRELFERLGGSGRLLNHAVIHADVPGEIEGMERELERYRAVGWKCYTMGSGGAAQFEGSRGWWLDDERTGIPFIERAIELEVPLICAHKGISAMVPAGSPRDVGPVAKAYPQVDFVIYHSGYEFPESLEPEEGPYTEETADFGVNRLVKTLKDSGVPPGSNVYAELGTTWFGVIRRPEEAAHVLGKLLLAVGEDNVIWGTDSIWYGPSQVSIDAFRAFQIPAAYRERYGYPELTPGIKQKILGLNAARVYGIDPAQARQTARDDDLAWLKSALAEYRGQGVPSVS
ncbi:MAG: amidohydrolase family protein [Proteobacteria bacterium]|nr:amidohydrolase family protein [Pseudomonadota bacterium]